MFFSQPLFNLLQLIFDLLQFNLDVICKLWSVSKMPVNWTYKALVIVEYFSLLQNLVISLSLLTVYTYILLIPILTLVTAQLYDITIEIIIHAHWKLQLPSAFELWQLWWNFAAVSRILTMLMCYVYVPYLTIRKSDIDQAIIYLQQLPQPVNGHLVVKFQLKLQCIRNCSCWRW